MTDYCPKYFFLLLVISLGLIGCQSNRKQKQIALYETHCASCHIAPSIEDLPKEIWEEAILPDMAARMGIRENGYDPLAGLSYEEMDAVIRTGIYPLTASISLEDWQLLKAYILEGAPDSLSSLSGVQRSRELKHFEPILRKFPASKRRSYTYLEFKSDLNKLILGDMGGEMLTYTYPEEVESQGYFDSPLVAYEEVADTTYVTTIGNIHPSAISKGRAYQIQGGDTLVMEQLLLRPVHTLAEDLNQDGSVELVISEFGNLTGELSLFIKNPSSGYDKKTLLNQPGTIRVVSEDMDKDGRMDLIALTSQGDESITILFQKEDLYFEARKVLRFSPIYGSSWFELIDYDSDGDLDLVTVHGDNADKSYVHKPYHGMRLHINDGDNNFKEVFFYPMNGATRVVADDFDLDGDIDFGLLSTFPDYEKGADHTFVFLENTDKANFSFDAFTVFDARKAKWFLMEKGDLDGDGDQDIILSSFALPFIPAPKELEALWKEEAVDLMILENKYQ
jgi:hypothetical protein